MNIAPAESRCSGPESSAFSDLKLWLVCALIAFGSLLRAWGGILGFDSTLVGTIIYNQYSGVHFPDGPQVMAVPKSWGIATVSPPNILYLGTSLMRVTFDQSQSRVRVCVGNPPGGSGKPAIMRAYWWSEPKGRYLPLATNTVSFAGVSDIAVPLEIQRPLDHDIDKVEIEYTGQSFVAIDRLEFDSWETGYQGYVDFDSYPDTTPVLPGAVLYKQYMDVGVIFPNQPVVIVPGVDTASPPNGLKTSVLSEVGDPQSLVINFDPPQGGVRLSVGNPNSHPLEVVLRAYSYSPYVIPPASHYTLLGSNVVSFEVASPIQTPLEFYSWAETNISQVQVEFSGNEWEVIDSLEFGPAAPNPVPDTQPPRVYLDSPANGTVFVRTEPPPAPCKFLLQGRVVEDRSLNTVTLYQDHLGTNVLTDSLVSVLNQSTPTTYTFQYFISLEEGTNRIRVEAADRAGHPATNAEMEISVSLATPEPLVVSGLSTNAGSGLVVIRDSPRIEIPPTGHTVTFYGSNLHDRIWVYLLPAYTTNRAGYSPLTITNRAGDWTWFTVTIPDSAYVEGGPDQYHFWIWDYWPGHEQWTNVGPYSVTRPAWTRLHGLGFHNEDEVGGWGDFCGVFGENAYIYPFPFIPCAVPDPLYLAYFAVYKALVDHGNGMCVGMSAVSLMLNHADLSFDQFIPGVHYTSGFTNTGKPDTYEVNVCSPWGPQNLWAYVSSMHGVQFSREVLLSTVSQMSGDYDYSVGGYPLTRLTEIRGNPDNFIIRLQPSAGRGHAMVPYQVVDQSDGSAWVYVYDCNKEYRHQEAPDSGPNQMSTNACIVITPDTRGRGTYSYRMASGAEWTGNGLYVHHRELWLMPHHAPGIELIGEGAALLWMVLSGSADGQYTDPDTGGAWGWNRDGKLAGTLPDIYPVSPMSSGDTQNDGVFLVTSNYDRLSIQANVHGSNYLFHAAQGGRLFQCQVRNGVSGDTDNLTLNREPSHALSSVSYAPARNGVQMVPMVGMNLGGKDRVLYKWGQLNIPAGEAIEVKAMPEQRGVQLMNRSSAVLRPILLLHCVNTNLGGVTNIYGPLEIPAHGAQQISLPEWPSVSRIKVQTGITTNGTFQTAAMVTGAACNLSVNPAGQDLNKNGLLDLYDIAFGDSQDINHNGIPDELEGQNLLWLEVTPASSNCVLRLRGPQNRRAALEVSDDLKQWTPLGTNDLGNGLVECPIAPSADRKFYRARLSGQ